jgi:fumarate hydratase class II
VVTERRIESDSLGEIAVPAEAYYGAQTERAKRNFPISGIRFPRPFLRALGLLKAAAAEVNGELGVVSPEVRGAIVAAAEEVVSGELDDHFPLDIFQTGSGTSTHMNANEVIANRAIEILGGEIGARSPVHPNDHVNAGQSSNDVIPSAIHLAAYPAVVDDLLPEVEALAAALRSRAADFDDVVKVGRTHLQDAVPIRLGQEFSGYARQLVNAAERLRCTLPRLAELALGGTAVGTGLNAPPEFAERVIERLAERTGQPFVPAPDRFEALAARDAAVETSGALRGLAVALTKIANDLRWLGSGPRCGIGELRLPNLQPGSSIMPGKVNPVIAESVLMVAAQVVGNDATISLAGMSGNFELNVMMPVIAHNLLQSIQILTAACRALRTHCIDGLEADRERAREMVERSLSLATALAPRIGYDAAAEIAREAWKSGRTVREVALERGVFPADELDRVLDPRGQTEGGLRE